MKKAKTLEEAWDIEDKHDHEPHARIQWKGTNVCMDLRCSCGVISHIDGEFCYLIQCPECKKTYACNGHIELIEVTNPDIDDISICS